MLCYNLKMSKLDELKERISFSTKLFFVLGGLIVLLVGGLINLYLDGNINEIFWLGICIVPFLAYLNLLVFIHIKTYIAQIGEL